MKADWFAYATRATHPLYGTVQVTHRSRHGHLRIVTTTGFHAEVCVENVTFPSPPPPFPKRKLSKPKPPRTPRTPAPSPFLSRLMAELFS